MSNINPPLPDGNDEPELESGINESALESGETEEIPAISLVNEGDSLMAVQSVINRQADRLDNLREEMRLLGERQKAILDNDAELAEAEEQLKSVSRKQKERKKQLTDSAESVEIRIKRKELQEQVKDIEDSLNNNLLSYYQMTGAKFFDTDDGGQRGFKVLAKVLGKKQKKERQSQ